MQVQKKSNISRGMIFEKYTNSNISWDQKKNKNKNKTLITTRNYDYIANSQCCGLYLYGNLLKDSKIIKET